MLDLRQKHWAYHSRLCVAFWPKYRVLDRVSNCTWCSSAILDSYPVIENTMKFHLLVPDKLHSGVDCNHQKTKQICIGIMYRL